MERFDHDADAGPSLNTTGLTLLLRSSLASQNAARCTKSNMIQRQAVVLALAATAVAWQPATRINSRATPLKMSEQLTDDEEAEIIANAQKIAKKKRSNLYNEDGVAYVRCSA